MYLDDSSHDTMYSDFTGHLYECIHICTCAFCQLTWTSSLDCIWIENTVIAYMYCATNLRWHRTLHLRAHAFSPNPIWILVLTLWFSFSCLMMFDYSTSIHTNSGTSCYTLLPNACTDICFYAWTNMWIYAGCYLCTHAATHSRAWIDMMAPTPTMMWFTSLLGTRWLQLTALAIVFAFCKQGTIPTSLYACTSMMVKTNSHAVAVSKTLIWLLTYIVYSHAIAKIHCVNEIQRQLNDYQMEWLPNVHGHVFPYTHSTWWWWLPFFSPIDGQIMILERQPCVALTNGSLNVHTIMTNNEC